MDQNSLTTNQISQKEARQKRRLKQLHKRAQILKCTGMYIVSLATIVLVV